MFNDDIQVFFSPSILQSIDGDNDKLNACIKMTMVDHIDDPQGTAATVLSGLYGAMKVQGLGPESLKDQVHPLYSSSP